MIVGRIAAGIVSLAVASSLVGGCRRGDTGPALRVVRVALPIDAISWHPVRLAQSHGFAARAGIALDISEAAGMSKGMEALLGGSVDVTAGQLGQVIQVAAEGRDVRCFLSMYSRPSLVLAVAPGKAGQIRSIADLKGKHVGVSSPGSPTHQFLDFLLTTHGLSTGDVGVVSIGSGASSIAAIEHGKVDAAVLVGSGVTTFEGRYPDVAFLVDPRTLEGAKQVFGVAVFPAGGLLARDRWLRENPDVAREFVRAVKDAMRWIAEHSPEDVRATIPEELRMPDADADRRAIHQAQQTMMLEGTIPPDAPAAVLRYLAASSEQIRKAHIDLESLYTNEFANTK